MRSSTHMYTKKTRFCKYLQNPRESKRRQLNYAMGRDESCKKSDLTDRDPIIHV